MPERVGLLMVLTPIGLLFIAFWRSSPAREYRRNRGFFRTLNDLLAGDYRYDYDQREWCNHESETPRWVARVHYEQLRTRGSGNGHWGDND